MHWIAPEMSHDTWTYECEPQLRLKDQLSLFNQYCGGGGKLDMAMSVNEGTPLLMSFFFQNIFYQEFNMGNIQSTELFQNNS